MKKSIKTILTGLLFVPVLALAFSSLSPIVSPVNAVCGDNTVQGGADCANVAGPTELKTVIVSVVNVALYIIGALSVLMLIYGGIRYTMSGGESAAVVAAKNTIMYSIIGVIVALLAYAIVNFVIENLTKTA